MTKALPLVGPHWSFALSLYARPGVADACLKLQDCAGVDVNVLLFALFAASECGIAFREEDLVDIDHAVAGWREEVVVKLRSVRRRLKSGPFLARGRETERLRDHLKEAELRAEQIEQAVLASWLEDKAALVRAQPCDDTRVLAEVAAFYARRCGRESSLEAPDLKQALHLIVEAHRARLLPT
jgi:uncharacterized protein (TIGR02444 family)